MVLWVRAPGGGGGGGGAATLAPSRENLERVVVNKLQSRAVFVEQLTSTGFGCHTRRLRSNLNTGNETVVWVS